MSSVSHAIHHHWPKTNKSVAGRKYIFLHKMQHYVVPCTTKYNC